MNNSSIKKSNNNKKSRACEMTQWLRTLVAKADGLNLTWRTHDAHFLCPSELYTNSPCGSRNLIFWLLIILPLPGLLFQSHKQEMGKAYNCLPLRVIHLDLFPTEKTELIEFPGGWKKKEMSMGDLLSVNVLWYSCSCHGVKNRMQQTIFSPWKNSTLALFPLLYFR